ncbi:MAG TPA: SH3 domain-containing protein [Gammaproteobacteria bacterium]|nr:SH3 domain-containing protein [Gammaproteobacteria bacterium]
MNRSRWLMMFVLWLLPAAVFAAGTARTIQPTALNTAPYSDAKAMSQLPVNTPVTLEERKGGWYHVRLSDGRQGWLRMVSVRLGEGAAVPAKGGWDPGAIASLFSAGRSSTTGTTATTGVRGLNEGTIQNAVPDPAAVLALTHFDATADSARKFAAALRLKTVKVNYLPDNAKGSG